jgi:hypothetical protein
MGRYNFVSGGAMAGNAISQFLAEREAQNRQQMLDRLAQEARTEQQRQQRETEGRQREQLDFQKQQEARVAAGQQATFADLANQREYTQVSGAVEGARPEDAPLDADMVAKVLRQGFGSRLKQIPGVVSQGAVQEEPSEANSYVPTYAVNQTPEQTTLRPGSKYLDAEAQRTFMEGQAEAARVGRLEDREAQRVWQGVQNELSRQNTSAIAGMGADIRRDAAAEKAAAKALLAAEKAAVVKSTRADVRELAQDIIDDPELDGVTGLIEGSRDTFYTAGAVDVKRRLDQLIAKIKLKGRDQLKGQGTITDFEGKMLSDAESAIDRRAGPDILRGHLRQIVEAFAGDAPNAPKPLGPTDPTGGGGATETPEARRARLRNAANAAKGGP